MWAPHAGQLECRKSIEKDAVMGGTLDGIIPGNRLVEGHVSRTRAHGGDRCVLGSAGVNLYGLEHRVSVVNPARIKAFAQSGASASSPDRAPSVALKRRGEPCAARAEPSSSGARQARSPSDAWLFSTCSGRSSVRRIVPSAGTASIASRWRGCGPCALVQQRDRRAPRILPNAYPSKRRVDLVSY
jgi:hypothetical protein